MSNLRTINFKNFYYGSCWTYLKTYPKYWFMRKTLWEKFKTIFSHRYDIYICLKKNEYFSISSWRIFFFSTKRSYVVIFLVKLTISEISVLQLSIRNFLNFDFYPCFFFCFWKRSLLIIIERYLNYLPSAVLLMGNKSYKIYYPFFTTKIMIFLYDYQLCFKDKLFFLVNILNLTCKASTLFILSYFLAVLY